MGRCLRPILLRFTLLLFTSAWACQVARAEHGSTLRQTPVLIGPMLTPEQETKEKSFWHPIYSEVQKSQRLLDQNDLLGAQQAAQRAVWLAGSRKGELSEELSPIYFQNSQYGKAAALFDANPFHAMSLNAAISYLKTGRLAEARKSWRESQMLPYHRNFVPYLPGLSSAKAFEATVFLCRGIADVDQNHHPLNAVWALHRAVQLVPNNYLALWYYAEALTNAGRLSEARRSFQKAILLDHGFVSRKAQEGMARLDHIGGR